MTKHEELQPVLEKEIERLSQFAWHKLVGELTDDEKNYEVSLNEKKYQVEVELVENDTDVIVVVAVDDYPTPVPSPVPSLCGSFRKEKD
jgi:hypothetical protein